MNVQAVAVPRSGAADYWALAKPGITAMVVVTTSLGYYIAAASFDWLTLAFTALGTALVSAGSCAINMAIEHDRDARMSRTEDRPVAAGRVSYPAAIYYGTFLSLTGLVTLIVGSGPLAAGLAALSLLVYLLAYTPLKPVTTLNTFVGAVSGAIPPMIGWAAARQDVSMGAWVLFAILFLWQMPHFLAIGWMYRRDYERAGFAMLPVVDAAGVATGRQAVAQTMALIVASLMPAWIGVASPVYYFAAAALGAAFLGFGLAFLSRRTDARARGLFLASIAYLPMLLGTLALTKV